MLRIIMDFCLAFLLIVGLVEIIRQIIFWILKTKDCGRLYLVVSLQGHDEQAEFILRSAAEKIKWCNIAKEKQILCIDNGMDEETRKVCTFLAKQFPVIHIYTPDSLSDDTEQ